MTVTIRDLSGMDEFRQAEVLQADVWGPGDLVDPADLMMVVQAEGGLCAGAFMDGALVGYVFGFPTRDPQIQHSHRLATRAAVRGFGLGARLKWYQRDWCLARGIRQVRWTFDPLRLPNASLNIAALGAIGRTYHPDYYGVMAGINAGAPSDRLLAEWFLDEGSVTARAAGMLPAARDPVRSIAIPRDYGRLLAEEPQHALAFRMQFRTEIVEAFAAGLEITGFDRESATYALTRRAT